MMNTEELPIEDANEDADPVEEVAETLVDDALIGQVMDEADGDQRAVLEWFASALEEAKDDRLRSLGQLTIMMNVRHHIVSKFALKLRNTIPVKRVAMLPQLLDLLLVHGEAESLLSLCETDP